MKKKVATIATAAILSSAFASTAFADTYTVKKGDTLSHIASNYSTTVSNLKSLNGLKSDLIFPNQKLTVSKTTQAKPSTSTPSAPSTTTTTTTSTYKIVSGDTLSAIASKHKVSVSNLKTWNKLTSDLIFPGQKLYVSDPAKGSTSTPAPETSEQKTPTVPAPSSETATTVYYKIKSGDTLSKIAQQHSMTVTQLKTLNNLSSDLIYAGQTIKVSGQASEPAKEATPASGADKVIKDAKALLGTPYVWGGSSSKGFDCSGFIYYVYNKSGEGLVRTSAEGYFNRSYYVDKPQPGDLVFFENTYKKGISHVGIYLGNNEFIHAGNDKVEISSLTNSYYKKHFDSFKRFY